MPYLRRSWLGIAVADERQEAVVADLDGVDVEHTLRARDEPEVDRMRDRPHLPAARDLGEELVLGLVHHVLDALALKQRDVREEHHAENGVPKNLVDEDLGEDHLRIFAGDQAIELAIEPVRRGAVDEEAEAGQPEEAVPVKRLLLNKFLGKNVAKRKASERGQSLHEKWLFVQQLIVPLPSINKRIAAIIWLLTWLGVRKIVSTITATVVAVAEDATISTAASLCWQTCHNSSPPQCSAHCLAADNHSRSAA
mmetsp:Transcript_9032/g.19577  ORF Transcript_9032/g.19577 Transcript_9032/m.19577 type:complete len:253 (-) Transcript_9032:167-925(-)